MNNKIVEYFEKIKELSPLVHCIVGPVSVNLCANAILAVGARPICAEYKKEVSKITSSADALMISTCGITNERARAVLIAARSAKKNNIPFVFDAVGVSCSLARRKLAIRIIKKYTPNIIKGNYSEITALLDFNYKSSGVDADPCVSVEKIARVAVEISKKYGCVVLASGKTDVIAKRDRVYFAKNGTKRLSSVTGTGCALGALTATFLSVASPCAAAVSACAVLGISGELAKCEGSGSFLREILDNLSTLNHKEIEENVNVEEVSFEGF